MALQAELRDDIELSRPKWTWRAATGALAGVLVLVAVVAVVWHFGDARRFEELIERAHPMWLLVAASLQTATYFCAGGIWWLVLRRSGASQPLRRLVVLSVAKLFTDEALPSGGVMGTLVLLRALVRRGVPVGIATAALVVNLIAFYAAFMIAAAVSLLFLWLRHDLNAVLVTMTALLFVVALAVPTSLLLLVRGGRSRFHAWLTRVRPARVFLRAFAEAPRARIRDRASLAGAFGLQLVTITLDAATLLAALAAVGEHVPPAVTFAAFVFAMIAEVISVAPAGLGTFEGTCVALLHMSGVGLEPALAATLLLRGFTFWLPMLPGVWLLQRETRPVRLA
jgi:uncharacterized protein (TIRG00374 family)